MTAIQEQPDVELDAFLRDLTVLSLKYKIGITVPVNLFVLESEDLDLVYTCDADGNLTF
jgi:hypothetical protein